jgi:hypothetical protein
MPGRKSHLQFEKDATLKANDPQARLVPAAGSFNPGEAVELVVFDIPLRKFKAKVVGSAQDKTVLAISAPGNWIPPASPAVGLISIKTSNVCYLEGRWELMPGKTGHLIVNHQGRALRTQRRLFHRFHCRKTIHLEGIILPDGRGISDMPAVLQDCSLIGLGIQTQCKLPPKTNFKTPDLFKPTNTEIDCVKFYLQIVWARGNRLSGFRQGAVFRFQSECEQNNYTCVVEQLQLKYLSDGYRSLG